MVDIAPRTWPNVSFLYRFNEYWEVTGGNVRFVAGKWRWRWRAARNTDLARHFSGNCGFEANGHYYDCIPCQQIDSIKRYGQPKATKERVQ